MRITIYSEPNGGLGGADYCSIVLASSLAAEHSVEIVHHRPDVRLEDLQACFGEDLSRVTLRYLPEDSEWHGESGPWWKARNAQRRWKSAISEGSDLLVSICHWAPPFCQADAGLLYVLFPIFERSREWPWSNEGRHSGIRQFFRKRFYDREWRARIASYDQLVSISGFTRFWTKQVWGCDSRIVYPPVDIDFPLSHKRDDVIVALGRFCEMKRQREMVETFRRVASHAAFPWRFECCGNAAEQLYFEGVRTAAAGLPVQLVVGASRSEVKRTLSRSKIFWHAAGYGVDEAASPARLEHFGIATVEAMAAGCVPIVPGKGGQPEIVQHGVTGFLWNELGELEEYTLQLMRDDGLRASMAEAAQSRAMHFSKQRFVESFHSLMTLNNRSAHNLRSA